MAWAWIPLCFASLVGAVVLGVSVAEFEYRHWVVGVSTPAERDEVAATMTDGGSITMSWHVAP